MSIERAQALGVGPCPMCGASDVRWRGRRLYDFPLTWARYFAELCFSVLASGDFRQHLREPHQLENDVRFGAQAEWERLGDRDGEMLETQTGWGTARRFWRCRSCKRKGQVFE